MSSFFETDREQFAFVGRTYQDYFSLYPNLWYKATLEHIQNLDEMEVVHCESETDGWRIAVRFRNTEFLLETHYHGTSTSFCVEDGNEDTLTMLAFLGCFLPVVRDSWREIPTGEFTKPQHWWKRFLGW